MTIHPVVAAVEQTVSDVMRHDTRVFGGRARQRVRAEITHHVLTELMHCRTMGGGPLTVPAEGPLQIHGVSYYLVDSLPEPGWRVIA